MVVSTERSRMEGVWKLNYPVIPQGGLQTWVQENESKGLGKFPRWGSVSRSLQLPGGSGRWKEREVWGWKARRRTEEDRSSAMLPSGPGAHIWEATPFSSEVTASLEGLLSKVLSASHFLSHCHPGCPFIILGLFIGHRAGLSFGSQRIATCAFLSLA